MEMSIEIAGIRWKNSITTAAGTFSYKDSPKYYDPALLGAVTTKGVSPERWAGNEIPRIAEVTSGMLNAVGLENPGVDVYIENELQILKAAGATVIANVAGHCKEDYLTVVRKLDITNVDMLELNVSCPNVREGGMAFGVDPDAVYGLTQEIKAITAKPVIVKLSPNVTDICKIAAAAERGGADALSLINTLVGMRIDLKTGRPILANGTGGLSGPAIKPIAISMVYRVSRSVGIPIIGMGGIMTGEDAYEFLLAGATAVAVGTAALIDPQAPVRVLHELEACIEKYGKPVE
ncbi:MAG: dihydroorotate dehydrogenase [Clostridiales Family XIII bacterium]|jgi:dihydroorotate dehydrogenase (NAD+) catalytic subunit|nr:dihydroorotate dehydrogenase [Clostridiales Family XIII bacterium]